MAEQDVPCPGCGYNLRGCQGAACPECGTPLELQVGSTQATQHLRPLRYLFLGLIIWNGAGTLPVAMVEMVRYWQAASGSMKAGGAFSLYVVGEIVIALLVVTMAILGLRSCRGRAAGISTSRYAITILGLQILVTIYHFVIVIFI